MTKNTKLLISVSDEDVRVFLVDAKTGKQQELQPGVNYTVEYVRKRTQRCQGCRRTFPDSEMLMHNGEPVCVQCYKDWYSLTDEDIPF